MVVQLVQCERLSSLIFLIKLEYSYIKQSMESALTSLKAIAEGSTDEQSSQSLLAIQSVLKAIE